MTGEATSSAAAQAGRAAAAGHQATANAAASGHHYQVRHVLPYFFLYSNHAEPIDTIFLHDPKCMGVMQTS